MRKNYFKNSALVIGATALLSVSNITANASEDIKSDDTISTTTTTTPTLGSSLVNDAWSIVALHCDDAALLNLSQTSKAHAKNTEKAFKYYSIIETPLALTVNNVYVDQPQKISYFVRNKMMKLIKIAKGAPNEVLHSDVVKSYNKLKSIYGAAYVCENNKGLTMSDFVGYLCMAKSDQNHGALLYKNFEDFKIIFEKSSQAYMKEFHEKVALQPGSGPVGAVYGPSSEKRANLLKYASICGPVMLEIELSLTSKGIVNIGMNKGSRDYSEYALYIVEALLDSDQKDIAAHYTPAISTAIFDYIKTLPNFVAKEQVFESVEQLLFIENNFNDANAQHYLGTCYQLGYGVDVNIDTAIEFFKKSAAQGRLDSQTELNKLNS